MVESVKFSPVNFQASLLSNVKNARPAEIKQDVQAPQIEERTGAEALSNYNKVNITKPQEKENILLQYGITPSDIKPLEKDFVSNPKVLNSSGNTDYYEARNGDISTIYRTVDGGEALSSIIEVNNTNGNKIREDMFDEKGNPFGLVEYNPETGIRKKYTSFDSESHSPVSVLVFDDKGEAIKSTLLEKDGSPKMVKIKEEGSDGGCYNIYKYEHGQLHYKFTETPDGTPIETTRYAMGKPVQTFVPGQSPVINTTDFDYKTLEYLKPSDIGNLETDVSKLDGTKKFRSNNTLEEVTVQDGNVNRTYLLDETGNKIKEIKETEKDTPTRTIFYDTETNTIDYLEEILANGESKKVKNTYFVNGKPDCVSEVTTDKDGNTMRSNILLNKDGNVSGYGIENSADGYCAMYTVNKNGELIDIKEIKNDKLIDKYYHDTVEQIENIADKPGVADNFKKALDDPSWTKVYVADRNVVTVSNPNMKDGASYDIFPNGTVYTYSGWGNQSIIMNSNEETAKIFDQYKK